MARRRRIENSLDIKASVWLKDEGRFAVVQDLDHVPRPGEMLEIDGERWRVVE